MPPPSPKLLEDSNHFLRSLQKLLGAMGVDDRRSSDEFKEVMGQYKELGTELHHARKRVPPPPPTARSSAPAGYGLTALGRARPVPSGQGTLRPTAGVSGRPAALAAPASGTAAPEQAGALALVATLAGTDVPPAAAALPEMPAAPPPTVERPLPMPKFTGTMGPPGSKAVDYGPPVTNLQNLLLAMGYPVAMTGEYDAKTFRAVQEFQIGRRLPVNGMVGMETRRTLNELVTGQEQA